MFDIGFSEMLVIAVVALIVIGPERLPKVARTLGILFGRMQRYVNDVKSDIQREMELDELRKLQASVQDAARSIEQSVNKGVDDTEKALQSAADPLREVAGATAAAPPMSVNPSEPMPVPPAPAAAASPGQLELGLDPATPLPKQG